MGSEEVNKVTVGEMAGVGHRVGKDFGRKVREVLQEEEIKRLRKQIDELREEVRQARKGR